MVLDNLKLSRNMNDQELLTVVRRFKEGDKYLYVELADLFSHIHFLNKAHSLSQAAIAVVDLPSLLRVLRSRSTQWRR